MEATCVKWSLVVTAKYLLVAAQRAQLRFARGLSCAGPAPFTQRSRQSVTRRWASRLGLALRFDPQGDGCDRRGAARGRWSGGATSPRLDVGARGPLRAHAPGLSRSRALHRVR